MATTPNQRALRLVAKIGSALTELEILAQTQEALHDTPAGQIWWRAVTDAAARIRWHFDADLAPIERIAAEAVQEQLPR